MLKSTSTLFDDLVALFTKHGFALYMVGGTSRDFILRQEIDDYDFATDATPNDMKSFLKDANFRFANFGTVSMTYAGEHVEITTLREEGKYDDFRHPGHIKFVTSPALDYVRRDFTINAIYIDQKYNILDYCGGVKDLEKRYLKIIGDANTRLREDPLRIIRAFRFIAKFNLLIDPVLERAIQSNVKLLAKLNPEKIKAEEKKVHIQDLVRYKKVYNMFIP